MPARHMPLVGIPTCVRKNNERVFHGVNERYPNAVIDAAGCLPVLIPAVGSKVDVCMLLDRLDGLLLTGSPSNVHPSQYGGAPSHPETLHDPQRDATTLPLIREAVRRDLPILAICRGIQELNVLASAGARAPWAAQPPLPERRARWPLWAGAQRRIDPGRPLGVARRNFGSHGQFAALPRNRQPGPKASGRGRRS
jgi:Peptidase C26